MAKYTTSKPSWVPEEKDEKFACSVMSGIEGVKDTTTGNINPMLASGKMKPKRRLIMSEDEYVDGVGVFPDSITLIVGSELELTSEVYPSTAVNKIVYWMSSDESVATLSAAQSDALHSGTPVTVTALREGTAEITVTTEEGGFTATCYVTVIPAAEESMKK